MNFYFLATGNLERSGINSNIHLHYSTVYAHWQGCRSLLSIGGDIVIVIVITFYLPSCLGQETAKGPFGLRVKLPPAHLSTTHGGGFTQSL